MLIHQILLKKYDLASFKSDVDKLAPVLVDSSKLNNAVKIKVFRNTEYDELVKKS